MMVAVVPKESDVRRFRLIRKEDETGISGTGHIADGVCFQNGKCVLSWRTDKTSVAVYDDIKTLISIHGHGGKTVLEWVDMPKAFQWGMVNAAQDSFENCDPEECAAKHNMVPDYVPEKDAALFLEGYIYGAEYHFGKEWRNFAENATWVQAMTVGGSQE